MSTKCDWLLHNTSSLRVYYDFADNKVHIELSGSEILTNSDLRELHKCIGEHLSELESAK